MVDRSNEERLGELASALADGVDAALPAWVETCVRHRLVAWSGRADDATMEAARSAGAQARADVGGRVRALLAMDPDEQWTNPLAIVRSGVSYPTGVLRAAGVPAVVRDPLAEEQFPDDDYDLTPTRFSDLDEELFDVSIAWGAAKAFVVKARHQGSRP